MGDFWVIANDRGSIMRNHTTLHAARRRSHRGSISRCLGSFCHVPKLPTILVYVGYLKMIVRYRTTSHDIVRRRGSPYDICAMVVRRRRTTSSRIVRRRTTSSRIVRRRTTLSRIVRHRTTVVRLSYDIV